MVKYFRVTRTNSEVTLVSFPETTWKENLVDIEAASYVELTESEYQEAVNSEQAAILDKKIKDYNSKVNRANKVSLLNKDYHYNGYDFQLDEKSRLNMTSKALSLQLNPDTSSVTWITNTKDADGKDLLYTFTRDEFIKFVLDVEAHYESLVLKDKR